jgi:hypothetical protein
MNRVTATLTVATAIAAFGATACSTQQTSSSLTKPVRYQQIPSPPALTVPTGNKLVAALDGTGVQIYQCTNSAWSLLEPAATLADHGKPVALHFKGPIWVSTTDGSEVGATAVPGAAVNHADAVSELLLKADETHGTGEFSGITYVQRVQTTGGLAPAGACANGTRHASPYSATYTFWSAVG